MAFIVINLASLSWFELVHDLESYLQNCCNYYTKFVLWFEFAHISQKTNFWVNTLNIQNL